MPQIPNDLHHQMVGLAQLRTCLNCALFTATDETENPVKICGVAGAVPPPEVIVYGCASWLDSLHDVPF